jgi:hypothetical protein
MRESPNPYAPPAAELVDAAASAAPYFATSPAKLLAMSVATFGIYPAWWTYQNWRAIRRSSGQQLWPAVRALFANFTNFALFPRLQQIGASAGVHTRVPHELLALAYFMVSMAISVSSEGNAIGVLLVGLVGFTYLPPNALARRINETLAPGAPAVAPWTTLNVVGAALGLVLFSLVLAAGLLPEEPA